MTRVGRELRIEGKVMQLKLVDADLASCHDATEISWGDGSGERYGMGGAFTETCDGSDYDIQRYIDVSTGW